MYRSQTLLWAKTSFDENTGRMIGLTTDQKKGAHCKDCPQNMSGEDCDPTCEFRVVIE